MINVLFFAQIREVLGVEQLQLESAPGLTADALRQQLLERGDKWQQALGGNTVLVAVNQILSGWETEVKAGDEVAFFPPVTGG